MDDMDLKSEEKCSVSQSLVCEMDIKEEEPLSQELPLPIIQSLSSCSEMRGQERRPTVMRAVPKEPPKVLKMLQFGPPQAMILKLQECLRTDARLTSSPQPEGSICLMNTRKRRHIKDKQNILSAPSPPKQLPFHQLPQQTQLFSFVPLPSGLQSQLQAPPPNEVEREPIPEVPPLPPSEVMIKEEPIEETEIVPEEQVITQPPQTVVSSNQGQQFPSVLQPFSLFCSDDVSSQTTGERRLSENSEDEDAIGDDPVEDDLDLNSTGDKKPSEFTIKEYCDMYLVYGECKTSCLRAKALYASRYPNRRHPNARTFLAVDRRVRETGQVLPSRRRNTDTQVVSGEEGNKEEIWDLVNEDAMKNDCTSHLSPKYENLHPYLYTKRQKFRSEDNESRVEFCKWLLEKNAESPDFLDCVLWNSEAMFSRKGIFNFESAQYWTVENPNSVVQQRIKERKGANLWVGVISNCIIGPHTLPDRLTPEYYNYFITEVLPKLLEDLPLGIRSKICFQQDGAPVHRLKAVRKELPSIFPGGWFGKNESVAWPPRSPDLNPVEFFLWNHLKNVVYKKPYKSVDDLLDSIKSSIASVTVDMLRRVRENVVRRARLCIQAGGTHFEHLL
ncbi:uncharacterized protein [Anabrus simplex]